MENTKTILESILLSEGRVEKAKERYPDVSERVFNYLVDNDPSGNQKYLDWMLGVVTDTGNRVGLVEFHKELIEKITYFHNNIQSFDKKDINAYKDVLELDRGVNRVKEKKAEKEAEKQAKKEKDVIHKDDRFLVISPKSYKASCYYGAGTKWCITTKGSGHYYDRYSKRATFYFIIDKTKDKSDDLYKVALRMVGTSKRIELWDAVDREFYNTTTGTDYLLQLPEGLLDKIKSNHEKHFPTTGEIDLEDPRKQALFHLLNEEDIEEEDFYHYGIQVFDVAGHHYAVGTEGQFDDALYDYFNRYDDDDLLDYYDPEGYYLYLNDETSFIEGEVDEYISNLTDEEVLEYTDNYSEYEELEDKLGNVEPDEEAEIEARMSELIDDSRAEMVDNETREWEQCLSSGVVDCLVNEKGWFVNGKAVYVHMSNIYLDRYGLIDSLSGSTEYEILANYDGYVETEEDDDGDTWYIVRVD